MTEQGPIDRLRGVCPRGPLQTLDADAIKERIMTDQSVDKPGRRLAAVVAAVALVIVTVGTMSFVRTPEKEVLHFADTNSSGAVDAESKVAASCIQGAAACNDVFYGQPTEFRLADGVDIPGGESVVWKVEPYGSDELRELAARFGVTDLVAGEDTGEAWNTIWQSDRFSASRNGQWSYFEPSQAISSCAVVAEPSDGSVADVPATPACDAIVPSALNLPDDQEAMRIAEEALPGLKFTVQSRDAWGVYLSGALEVGGSELQWWGSVTLGENGRVLSASSTAGRVESIGKYDTVSAAAAVSRLSSGFMARMAPVSDTAAASDEASLPTPETTSAQESTAPIGMSVGCVVEPTPQDPDPVVVELVKVRSSEMVKWGAEGEMWVVPSYVYTDSNGAEYEAVALDESAYDVPVQGTAGASVRAEQAPTVGAPEGKTTGVTTDLALCAPGEDAGASYMAAKVVGSSLVDAEQILTDAGFEHRVVREDQESFNVTADYSERRVNLEVDNGVVTKAYTG